MINLLIADDHQIFIDGLKSLLENDHQFNVIAEANNGKQVVEHLNNMKNGDASIPFEKQIHIAILDVNMPEMNGVECTKFISKHFQEVRTLILTMHNRKEFIVELIAAGASGYLLKNCSKQQLVEALLTIDKGKDYFSHEITETVISSLKMIKKGDIHPVVELSNREIEVLQLIAKEFTTKEIAVKLFISENTVETHRRNLISKLNVRNTAGLVRYAVENKIGDLS